MTRGARLPRGSGRARLPAPHRPGAPARASARSLVAPAAAAPARARQGHGGPGRRSPSPPSAAGCWSSSRPASPGFQFVSQHTWIADLGISWHLGVDGISLFLVVLTGLLFPIAMLATDPDHDDKPYYAWLLVLEAGCLGVFLALDLFLFFVFFEIVLVPMYFLIGGWGHGERVYAATKFFLYTMFGSAFMLVGILTPGLPDRQRHRRTRSPSTWSSWPTAQALAVTTARWLFLAFALAFAVKVAAVPAAHLAARRPHRGADGRLGDPGRRHAEAGHLRLPALRPVPLPRGLGLLRPGAGHPRRDRHHLRRRRGHDAEGPEAARGLLVGGPPRLHRPRHLRLHHPGPRRAACCRWSTTASPPARCSCSSA